MSNYESVYSKVIRYSEEEGVLSDYDALLKATRQNPTDANALSAFADYLEENSLPGAAVAREGVKTRMGDNKFNDNVMNDSISAVHHDNPVYETHPHAIRRSPDTRLFDPKTFSAEFVRRGSQNVEPKSPVYLLARYQGETGYPSDGLIFRIPVFSKNHLEKLMADWTDHMKEVARDRVYHLLGENHYNDDLDRFARVIPRKHVGNQLLNILGTKATKGKSYSLPWLNGATLDIHHWTNPETKQAAYHVIHTGADGTESNTVMTEPELYEYMGKPTPQPKQPEEYVPADIFNYHTVKPEQVQWSEGVQPPRAGGPVKQQYHPGMEPPQRMARPENTANEMGLLRAIAADQKAGKQPHNEFAGAGWALADHWQETGEPLEDALRAVKREDYSSNKFWEHQINLGTVYPRDRPYNMGVHFSPENKTIAVNPVFTITEPGEIHNKNYGSYYGFMSIVPMEWLKKYVDAYPELKEHFLSNINYNIKENPHKSLVELKNLLEPKENYSRNSYSATYARVANTEIHPDYQPHGIAPRLGVALQQMAGSQHEHIAPLAETVLRTGDLSVLPVLADALDEADHPLAKAFDYRHAPRAISIDKAVQAELNQHAIMGLDGQRRPLHPAWVAQRWLEGHRNPFATKTSLKEVAKGAESDATIEDVWHSLLRLSLNRNGRDGLNKTLLTEPHLNPWQIAHNNHKLKTAGLKAVDVNRYPDTRTQATEQFARGRRGLISRVKSMVKRKKVKRPTVHLTTPHSAKTKHFERDLWSDGFKVVQYAAKDYKEEDFHRAIEENPQEFTNHLVYADWLEEMGREHEAAFIRHALKHSHDNQLIVRPYIPSGWSDKAVKELWSYGSIPTTVMNVPLAHDKKKELWYVLKNKNVPEIKDIVSGLEKEGYYTHESAKQAAEDSAEHYSRVRYSLEDEEKSFHALLESNPEDKTTALIYADWLEEYGKKPEIANLIRKSINQTETTEYNHYNSGRTNVSNHDLHTEYYHPSGFTVHAAFPDLLGLGINNKNNPNKILWWSVPTKDGAADLEKVLPEVDKALEHTQLNLPVDKRDPSKYSAYKAPAGGIVVDNLFYQGGQLIPNLQKYSAAAGTRPWMKKLRKKWKVTKALNTVGSC